VIHGDLSVRINDGRTDKIVSKQVSNLEFSTVAPGGHGSISFHLDAPWSDWDIDGNTKMWVYDGRTAECLCEGLAEDPGREYSGDGEGWDITAHGGAARLTEQSEAALYIDRLLDRWTSSPASTPSANTTVTDDPGYAPGRDALVMQFNPGQPITTGDTAAMRYETSAGGELGGFGYTWDAGQSANHEAQAIVSPSNVSVRADAFTTAGGTQAAALGFTAFPEGQTWLTLRQKRVAGGATTVGNDNLWVAFSNVYVRGVLYDKSGVKMLGLTAPGTAPEYDYELPYILASDVVADMVGRLLTFCDGASARIDVSTYHIDQLAYPDGARAVDRFNDLALFEPDQFAEVLESNAAGLHRFNYRAWDTAPRTVLSTGDGYVQPGSETDQADRIAVYWVNSRGIKKTTVVTAVVEGLTRTVDAEAVDLGDRAGTAANATRVGEQVLAAQNAVSKAATAVVTRDVLDRYTGARWKPWEHRAGYPSQVQQTGDVLRVTETRYVDNDEAVTLTLGSPARTREQIVADNTRRRR